MASRRLQLRWKNRLRLLIWVASLMVLASTLLLARWWFQRERMSFEIDWDAGSPISANLFQFGWGEELSVTDHPDPDKPGYILDTHRLWYIGPFGVRRVLYERPGYERKW